jgi:enamine deaminase RidA (YjgF/YER057c/UK114 family)
MSHEKINPPALFNSLQYGFSHAVAHTDGHSGARTIECAGQVAWDRDCNLVGEGDFAAQAREAFRNVQTVLKAAGATPADVVRLRTYIVDHDMEKLEALGPIMAEFYGEVTPAANTLIGVQALALPGFLIEVEATAVVG